MRVAMVGSGYVGLVSGACFADFGHEVVCIDKDPAKIAALQAGRIPIFEPGLAALVADNARQGRLTAIGLEGVERWYLTARDPAAAAEHQLSGRNAA